VNWPPGKISSGLGRDIYEIPGAPSTYAKTVTPHTTDQPPQQGESPRTDNTHIFLHKL